MEGRKEGRKEGWRGKGMEEKNTNYLVMFWNILEKFT
jgi:hypothetical protein